MGRANFDLRKPNIKSSNLSFNILPPDQMIDWTQKLLTDSWTNQVHIIIHRRVKTSKSDKLRESLSKILIPTAMD
jgi:hypothetical protein